jgi:glucosamine--fructose-6-phosphate aminotransferase (isomerizing)
VRRRHVERAGGKLVNLETVLANQPLPGVTGIGHTRWATHGAPSEANAHPHGTARVAVVHNGIIENHMALRAELQAAGQNFASETDTETVAQLLDLLLGQGMDPVEAARTGLARLEGAYALAIIFTGHPELLIGAQYGAPLAVGFGGSAMYLGSDALALAPLTPEIAYLEDGDMVVVRREGAAFFDRAGAPTQRLRRRTALSGAATAKGNFRHYMEKEMHEQPVVIGDLLHQMVAGSTRGVVLPPLPFDAASLSRVTISACGSGYYAGLVGKFWLENTARISVDIDVASEFRYRLPPLSPGGLGLLLSQSGETADTLAALRYMKSEGQKIVSIVNVVESSIARASDMILDTIAGPEISVASTKAFTAQLTVLALFTLAMAASRA